MKHCLRHSVLLMMSLSAIALIAPVAHAHTNNELLDSKPIKQFAAVQLPRWKEILDSNQSDLYNAPSKNVQNWTKFTNSLQGMPKLRQLLKVNMWFKQFPYKQDNWVYKQDDYWASPIEFLNKGGDCEDYAIIKYMTLRKLGFAAQDMKIAIVYDVYSGTDHAFLVVKYEGAEYVLDTREKMVVVRYMKNRYKPHYAFNEKRVWVYDTPLMAQKIRKYSKEILPGNR